jgi:hypothetical protein
MPWRIAREIAELIESFATCCAEIWESYQNLGVGRLTAGLFGDPTLLSQRLLQTLGNLNSLTDTCEPLRCIAQEVPSLLRSVERCRDLSMRCKESPAGLCFVTGEAGLIPRRDLEDQLQQDLEFLAAKAAEYRQLAVER